MYADPAFRRQTIDLVKHVFHRNTMEGYSKWKDTRYKYIAPADKEYIYQWLWDTAFHAIVLSNFDIEWAKDEIRNFLLGQREDGFLPHVIFWGNNKVMDHWCYVESDVSFRPRTTAITQPPMLPIAVEEIYRKDHDREFLASTLPKLARHHKWLLNNRDEDDDFLISIISPNESGMDELPVFQYAVGFLGQDPVRLHYYYRKADMLNILNRYNSRKILEKDYFNVEELLFNCVFIESANALSRLFLELDDHREAAYFENVGKGGMVSLLEKCWDDKDQLFYSLFSKDEKQAKVKTVASLMPLFLDDLPEEYVEAVIEKHLKNPKEFWLEYPVPSVSRDEPYYEPGDPPKGQGKLLWRGPTWMNTNWFIVKGLQKHGRHDVADEIVFRMKQMVQKSGFREYYNPETGEGYRRKHFGWSTLLLDLL